MSSYEKVIKGACKPKAAPPKAKYLDPIIAATFSEDGSIHDVCKALSPRFREPNAVVVFKALIVLHTMIRTGATDNILAYLSSSDVLRLRNVSGGQWEGYSAPENLQNYATYLDARIRAYKELKHDPVKVQSEVNRDMRVENSIEDQRSRSGRSNGNSNSTPSRSKTITGRKLRVMTVEKGLLRETKAVQKVISALLDCRFYLDNLEDDLTITALRMLVKDLLVLFQAVNEGVINVLEHYFEMSHIDAEQALNIYRNFCKQTERVVEYLSIAKKLQNLLNVPIPNLKHAPVSLAGALQEYLDDPNFEQNRIEYRVSKSLADKNEKERVTSRSKGKASPASPPARSATVPLPSSPEASTSTAKPEPPKELVDLFASIEQEQHNMFNPATNSPSTTHFHQQAAHNPFVQRQSMMMTGAFPQQPFGQPNQPGPFMQAQPTGFPGAFPGANGFAPPQQQQQQQPQQTFQTQPFLSAQPTGFLQPQATGFNPFRQSMLLPQATGFPGAMPSFTGIATANNPFPPTSQSPFALSVPPASNQPQSAQAPAFGAFNTPPPVPQQPPTVNGQAVPQRPASTPITSHKVSNSGEQNMQPVVSHQTGSRNPFGIPQTTPPPVPKPPTLLELATGFSKNQNQNAKPAQSQFPNFLNGAGTSGPSGQPTGQAATSAAPGVPGGGMSNIASSFTFNKSWSLDSTNKSTSPSLGPQSTANSSFSAGTSLFSQPTGASTATSVGTSAASPLQPQATGGLAGLKAFKPSSSFGASLFETLPPIPEPTNGTPPGTTKSPANALPSIGLNGSSLSPSSQPTSTTTSNSSFTPSLFSSSSPNGTSGAGTNPLNSLNPQPTGFTPTSSFGTSLGVGLRPQATGTPNPFRASMLNPTGTGFGGLGSSGSPNPPPIPGLSANAFGQQPSFLSSAPTGQPFSSSFGGTPFGSSISPDPSKQQQNGVASLI